MDLRLFNSEGYLALKILMAEYEMYSIPLIMQQSVYIV